MVPAPLLSVMVAPVAFDNPIVKVSLGSTLVSPTTLSVIVAVDAPAANVTVPFVWPVKSAAVVVPCASAQSTLDVEVRSPVRVTVKVIAVGLAVPPLPSVTDACRSQASEPHRRW